MQLGGLRLGVELHAGHDLLGVNRRVLRCKVTCERLQWALVAFFFTEHRCCWQHHLHHCTAWVVLQHHGKTLLIAASTAVTCT